MHRECQGCWGAGQIIRRWPWADCRSSQVRRPRGTSQRVCSHRKDCQGRREPWCHHWSWGCPPPCSSNEYSKDQHVTTIIMHEWISDRLEFKLHISAGFFLHRAGGGESSPPPWGCPPPPPPWLSPPPPHFKMCTLHIHICNSEEHTLVLMQLWGLEHTFWLIFPPPFENFLEKSLLVCCHSVTFKFALISLF